MHTTTHQSRAVFLLLPVFLLLTGCADGPLASELSLNQHFATRYFDAPHYPAASDPTLPRIYFEGAPFDPFCETAPSFVPRPVENGFVLSMVKAPDGPRLYTRADCDRIYKGCTEGCKKVRNPRARALCYIACMSTYAGCLAGDPFFSKAPAGQTGQ